MNDNHIVCDAQTTRASVRQSFILGMPNEKQKILVGLRQTTSSSAFYAANAASLLSFKSRLSQERCHQISSCLISDDVFIQ